MGSEKVHNIGRYYHFGYVSIHNTIEKESISSSVFRLNSLNDNLKEYGKDTGKELVQYQV
ncbi:MAG: hypothetical protein ACFE9Q_00230 [Candidatus Hodarchaeota archaeon]